MNRLQKLGERMGHELNLLYQKDMYLTSRGWKRAEGLGAMIEEIYKELEQQEKEQEQ